MSARLTTSPARRTRYSSSAYSFAVSGTSRVADAHLAAARVDRQRPDRQPLGQQRLAPAADQRAQPREQLAEIERLDEVVVGAAVQPFDARLHGVARGQHQDRHGAARLANRAADGEAVAPRQHDVEDHRVVVGGADLEDARCRRRRPRPRRRPARAAPWPAREPRPVRLRRGARASQKILRQDGSSSPVHRSDHYTWRFDEARALTAASLWLRRCAAGRCADAVAGRRSAASSRIRPARCLPARPSSSSNAAGAVVADRRPPTRPARSASIASRRASTSCARGFEGFKPATARLRVGTRAPGAAAARARPRRV